MGKKKKNSFGGWRGVGGGGGGVEKKAFSEGELRWWSWSLKIQLTLPKDSGGVAIKCNDFWTE